MSNHQPILIDVTKLADEPFLVLLQLLIREDCPFDDDEVRAIAGSAWHRGMLIVDPEISAAWKADEPRPTTPEDHE